MTRCLARYRRSAIPALFACAVAACNGDAAGPTGPTGPIDELPRDLTATEEQVIARSNAFGLDLLREVHAAEHGPNVFLSPLSASMALGMTLNGAAGGTFDAMRTALHLEGVAQREINESYASLLDLLLGLDPRVTLAIGNSVWSNEDVPFHDSFFDAVTTHFDAEVASLDFSDPATLSRINGWADEATNGRIDEILDAVSPDHIMFLLNAVYFKGQWTARFDPAATRTAPFTRPDGSSVEVDMMHREPAPLRRATSDGYQAIELPYGGGAFVMTLVVPTGDRTLRDVVASMDDVAWGELVASLDSTALGVAMPKFVIEYEKELNHALTCMGMGVAFTGAADFSRLSPVGAAIDFVRQKTFVQVDEKGTEAAAVTAVGMFITSASPMIVIDRPFLFAIRERLSGTILFIGTIADPTVRTSEGDGQPPSTCRSDTTAR